MNQENSNQKIINVFEIAKVLLAKKKVFFIVWAVVFVLSCIWVLPKPRYYNCDVSLAPETAGDETAGGSLSSLASSFGVNIGGTSSDAIYPELYPDLFESPEFIVSLFNIQVKTEDGSIKCDYYTYLAKHQKQNWLTAPFAKMMQSLSEMMSSDSIQKSGKASAINPFKMSKFDNKLVESVESKIKCAVDKKTNVISITVQDQDPMVCAILADSVRARLQTFITEYRTHKTRLDVQHYQELADSANLEYRSSVNEYAQFCDANQDIILQSQMSRRDELENEMQMKFNTYQALKSQLEGMKTKLQERTPAFTTLKSATVPVKPAGPKRMIFVFGMLVLATIITSVWLARTQLRIN